MESSKKAVVVEASRKGKEKVDARKAPTNLPKDKTRGVQHMDVDEGSVYRTSDEDENNSEEEGLLVEKIVSARVALKEANEKLAALKGQTNVVEGNENGLGELKKEFMAILEGMEENDKEIQVLKKTRDYVMKKDREGRWHVIDDCAMLEKKLSILQHRRLKVQLDKEALLGALQEKEERFMSDALQEVVDLQDMAMTPEYGRTPEELETLRLLVELHERNIPVFKKKLNLLKAKKCYLNEWRRWKIAARGLNSEELEQLGPEPEEKDFFNFDYVN